MNDIKAESEERLVYETPELVDRGDVSMVTQTALNTTGTDSGYS